MRDQPHRDRDRMIDRRAFLASALAFAGANVPASGQGGKALRLGETQPFSWDGLKTRARSMAARPYEAPRALDRDAVQAIDYDAVGKIRYKPEAALWADGPGRYPVTFFHPGRYAPKPVRMNVVEDGRSREILYDPAYFDMPEDSPARRLPADTGFAGFRFQESRDGALSWRTNDWVAFQGASYFRTIGELYQYGLSARGLAVDTVVFGRNEEFPDFTHVWFETQADADQGTVVCALLDGPSATGAYRFTMRRTRSVSMDVEVSLNLRRDVSRLGLAPLTSMYWFSETAKPGMADWRPEVHDSDGLALWTGSGERIWRPLNDPPHTVVSAFADERPRGFGLLQRDRNFDHYLDGVYYDRRPSAWVEPLGDWGKGSVQLVENRTDDEIHDNVVAMWVPDGPARAGDARDFAYRLHWLADEPYPSAFARCVATRLGNGGREGTDRPRGVRKFVVEFLGEPLTRLAPGILPEPVLTASRGTFTDRRVAAVPDGVQGHWRAEFDLMVEGAEPVDLRLFLRRGEDVLTETWLGSYHPSA